MSSLIHCNNARCQYKTVCKHFKEGEKTKGNLHIRACRDARLFERKDNV